MLRLDNNTSFLGDMTGTLWIYSLCFSFLMVFYWVSILLCMGVSLHGLCRQESFELRVLQEGVWELPLMFHAFYSMLVSIWVLNLNKFWMISFLEVLSFFRNFLSSIWLFYLPSVSYWFLLFLLCSELRISVFMSSSRTSLTFLYLT